MDGLRTEFLVRTEDVGLSETNSMIAFTSNTAVSPYLKLAKNSGDIRCIRQDGENLQFVPLDQTAVVGVDVERFQIRLEDLLVLVRDRRNRFQNNRLDLPTNTTGFFFRAGAGDRPTYR